MAMPTTSLASSKLAAVSRLPTTLGILLMTVCACTDSRLTVKEFAVAEGSIGVEMLWEVNRYASTHWALCARLERLRHEGMSGCMRPRTVKDLLWLESSSPPLGSHRGKNSALRQEGACDQNAFSETGAICFQHKIGSGHDVLIVLHLAMQRALSIACPSPRLSSS